MYSHGCLFGWMLQCQNPPITPLFVPHKVPLNKGRVHYFPFCNVFENGEKVIKFRVISFVFGN